MKHITLGRILYRILAKAIDVVIVLGLSLILFFSVVFNATFDRESYVNNQVQINEFYVDSGLYLESKEGTIQAISSFNTIASVSTLTSVDVTLDKTDFKNVNITDALYKFYSEKYTSFGGQTNLNFSSFKKMILKTGSTESNIRDLTVDNDGNYLYDLLDAKEANKTVNYVLEQFNNAVKLVENSSQVSGLNEANRKIMVSSIVWFIPLLAGFSFIFDLIVPLFTKDCKTIGMMIFKLGLVSKDGYKLKKVWLIPHWISYFGLEFILGIMSFGATIIISYTMMMFSKNRRCLHDFLGNTVVINSSESFYFNNPQEERYLMEHRRSIDSL